MNWIGCNVATLRDYSQAVKKPINTHENNMLKQSVMPVKENTTPEVFPHTSAVVKNDNHDKRAKRALLILGVNEDIQEFTDVTKEQIMTLKKVHEREDFFVEPLTVPEGAKSASFKIGAHFSIIKDLYDGNK
ncbi:hypothetical protein HHI36_002587 [Cryptolaemus montrouzieri]|uniref:Uncharacterized protein n=1 Tax=Cryptolaemus montrouzieri TaxID=559131 RepID=A0ABD2PAX1_9CUCU